MMAAERPADFSKNDAIRKISKQAE